MAAVRSTSASLQVYRWDERLPASFLPFGRFSGDHAQVEVLTADHPDTARVRVRYLQKYDHAETVFVRLHPA